MKLTRCPKTRFSLSSGFGFWFCVVLLGLASCGGNGATVASGDASPFEQENTNSAETSSSALDNVQELALTGDTLEFAIAPETAEGAVLLLAGTDDSGNTQAFEIAADGSTPPALFAINGNAPKNEIVPPENADVTELVHRKLRRREKKIASDAALPERRDAPAARFASKNALAGATESFNVLTSFESGSDYTDVNAVLAYSGAHYDLFVDARDLDAFAEADLQAMAENFDAMIPEERALFGAESDVDGDGRFAILLTREVNRLGYKYGGLVTGFFYATDLFDRAEYPGSNEREVVFGIVPDPDGEFGAKVSYNIALNNILPGVLVHEFQHMINFNRHYFVSGAASESPWLNEALSHLAEDLRHLDGAGFMASSGPENPSRVARYLEDTANVCFACGSTLQQRGGSYLFLRYLYEQAEKGFLPFSADGTDFVAKLADGSRRDVKNVSYAISGDADDEESFKEYFARFGLALYLSGTGLADDARLEFAGLNLRGPQDDNRGTYLNGPAVATPSSFPYVDTVTGYGFSYVQLSPELLEQTGGTVTVNVSDGSRFKAFLIQ